jgi:hypothetical protein
MMIYGLRLIASWALTIVCCFKINEILKNRIGPRLQAKIRRPIQLGPIGKALSLWAE